MCRRTATNTSADVLSINLVRLHTENNVQDCPKCRHEVELTHIQNTQHDTNSVRFKGTRYKRSTTQKYSTIRYEVVLQIQTKAKLLKT